MNNLISPEDEMAPEEILMFEDRVAEKSNKNKVTHYIAGWVSGTLFWAILYITINGAP